MKDVSQLRAHQVRIFRPDQIPFAEAQTGVGQEFVKEGFRFRTAVVNPDSGELLFNGGTLAVGDENDRVITIDSLTIGERRILLNVLGTSIDAGLVFEKLLEMFTESGSEAPQRDLKPAILTEEASCVVTLDVEPYSLFSESVRDFLQQEFVEAASTLQAKARIERFQLRFQVAFSELDQSLEDQGITVADKMLIIEPRAGVPLEANRFFTQSPTDTEGHLNLCRAFEARFLG